MGHTSNLYINTNMVFHIYIYIYAYGQGQFQGKRISNSYTCTMVCPPVREDNPLSIACRLSSLRADKPWYNYIIPSSQLKTFAEFEVFCAKVCKGGINYLVLCQLFKGIYFKTSFCFPDLSLK